MSHSFNKIWIHAIWSTKYRTPFIHYHVENKIYQFISDQLREQGCYIKIINGMPDHIHCLFLLNPKKFGKSLLYNHKGNWRYRVEDYRIICRIEEKELIILVLAIGHRKNIYKK